MQKAIIAVGAIALAFTSSVPANTEAMTLGEKGTPSVITVRQIGDEEAKQRLEFTLAKVEAYVKAYVDSERARQAIADALKTDVGGATENAAILNSSSAATSQGTVASETNTPAYYALKSDEWKIGTSDGLCEYHATRVVQQNTYRYLIGRLYIYSKNGNLVYRGPEVLMARM